MRKHREEIRLYVLAIGGFDEASKNRVFGEAGAKDSEG